MTNGPIIVEVRGAEQLEQLARRLKDAGEKDMRREFLASLTRMTEPLRKVGLPASARATLPRRGGLAESVARSKFKATRRLTGRSVGLRITAVNPDLQLRKLDDGQVRHPVFDRQGKRRVWVRQPVKPGWFTRPTEAAGPPMRAEADRTMAIVAARIEGKIP